MNVTMLVAAMLVLSQDAGTIRVRSDVAGVKVFLNGNEVGETPLTTGPLPAGKHEVLLVKDGFAEHREEVEVRAGAAARMFVVMRRVDVKLPDLPLNMRVAHQHRTGICVGMLIVSADELHYRAENGEDDFHMPFARVSSVSRSLGSAPMVEFSLVWEPGSALKTKVLPMRVELADRGYGFLAIAGDQSKAPPNGVIWNKETGEETTKLFQTVFELWTRTLKAPK